jgi:hypothetical protein
MTIMLQAEIKINVEDNNVNMMHIIADKQN